MPDETLSTKNKGTPSRRDSADLAEDKSINKQYPYPRLQFSIATKAP